jgi:uncharacterized protein YneF (UPF0154 family)
MMIRHLRVIRYSYGLSISRVGQQLFSFSNKAPSLNHSATLHTIWAVFVHRSVQSQKANGFVLSAHAHLVRHYVALKRLRYHLKTNPPRNVHVLKLYTRKMMEQMACRLSARKTLHITRKSRRATLNLVVKERHPRRAEVVSSVSL